MLDLTKPMEFTDKSMYYGDEILGGFLLGNIFYITRRSKDGLMVSGKHQDTIEKYVRNVPEKRTVNYTHDEILREVVHGNLRVRPKDCKYGAYLVDESACGLFKLTGYSTDFSADDFCKVYAILNPDGTTRPLTKEVEDDNK